jgi:uncharacterized protein YecE (DUF72 family)
VLPLSLRIGTSGWYYDDWVGPFYDSKRGMFTQYAKIFKTAEVNSTFYRYPSQRMVSGLYRTAPHGFIFSLKLPQIITHEKWLDLKRGVESDTLRFLDLVRPLAEKLGPILIQLRPKFNYDEHVGALESYLECLPKTFEWAVEFRHLSWMNDETLKILARNGAAYTIVDEPLLPPDVHVTSDFSYIRWHGHGVNLWYDYDYNVKELTPWVPKLDEIKVKTKRVYGYFNNHFRANAVKNAVEILKILKNDTVIQNRILEKIKEHRRKISRQEIRPLDSFTVDELSVSDHLIKMTTSSRLARAEKIEDKNIDISEKREDFVKATIGKYFIEVDTKNKILKHDCEDWAKGLSQKRICKHVAKLFLVLPPEQAAGTLSNIMEKRDEWQFESI